MKKFLSTLLLAVSLILFSSTIVSADLIEEVVEDPSQQETDDYLDDIEDLSQQEEASKSSSSFNVREILTISGESGTGEESINANFINQAEAEGTSVAGLLILKAINILSLLIGTFAFVTIVIGGFTFVTAGGDETRIDRGKAIVNQSIFGLIIAFMSYFIVTFIISFFY